MGFTLFVSALSKESNALQRKFGHLCMVSAMLLYVLPQRMILFKQYHNICKLLSRFKSMGRNDTRPKLASSFFAVFLVGASLAACKLASPEMRFGLGFRLCC